MKLAKTLFWRLFGAVVVALPAAVAKAAQGDTPQRGGTTFPNPLGTTSVGDLLAKFLDALVQVGVVIIILAYVWAGFKYVSALGEEKAVKEAHNVFYYTTIGAAILLGARVIATVLKGTINQLGVGA